MNPIDALRIVVDFFKGQPFSNVISFLQLIIMTAATWYAMTVMIPAERVAIIEGQDRMEVHQNGQVKDISLASENVARNMAATFEKALDRYDRRQANRVEYDGDKRATVGSKNEFSN